MTAPGRLLADELAPIEPSVEPAPPPLTIWIGAPPWTVAGPPGSAPTEEPVLVVPSTARLTNRPCPPPYVASRPTGKAIVGGLTTVEPVVEPALPLLTTWIGAVPWTVAAPTGSAPVEEPVSVAPPLVLLTNTRCPPPYARLRLTGRSLVDELVTVAPVVEPAPSPLTTWIGAVPWTVATPVGGALTDEPVTVELALPPLTIWIGAAPWTVAAPTGSAAIEEPVVVVPLLAWLTNRPCPPPYATSGPPGNVLVDEVVTVEPEVEPAPPLTTWIGAAAWTVAAPPGSAPIEEAAVVEPALARLTNMSCPPPYTTSGPPGNILIDEVVAVEPAVEPAPPVAIWIGAPPWALSMDVPRPGLRRLLTT